ncbi:MAG: PfkB family carbohydrate kinase [Candidatus Nezhaarchaeota archaeon]|nr:PfkB family carbohydrate kinase [Candidatus Nezhaarchaeota archaeon]
MYDLVCIGNPVYDIIETPYVKTHERILSGCSVNAALTAKRLGLQKVALIGRAGGVLLKKLLYDLASHGLSQVYIRESLSTGGFKLTYSLDLRSRTLEVIGGFEKLRRVDIPLELLDARVILIGPVMQEVDLELLEFIRKNTEAELFLDPQGLVRKLAPRGEIVLAREERLKEVVKLCDYVKPNEEEARVMTQMEREEAVRELRRWGAKVGIVTLADQGSIIYDGRKLYKIPAYQTRAIDPTGAGDVYAGAFIFSRLKGYSLLEAGLFASAIASIKVEHVGLSFLNFLEEGMSRMKALRVIKPAKPATHSHKKDI